MGRIIFTIIFTFFFAKFMAILFSDEYSGFSKKMIIKYIISQNDGALACATENIYKNIQNFYQENKFKLIEDEIKNKNCLVLKKGDELEAYEGICDVADKNQVKMFKSKKVFLQKIFIPCFAVEAQKILNNNDKNIDKEIKNNHTNPTDSKLKENNLRRQ